MYEELLINKILEEGNINIIIENQLEPTHFLTHKKEVEFILNHYRTYGNVPDKAIFLKEFGKFEIYVPKESTDYLVYNIKEASIYKDLVPSLKQVEKLIKNDSVEAIEYIEKAIKDIMNKNPLQTSTGTDIISRADERYREYEKRMNTDGLLGITTGIDLLDDYTHGWLGEDLITILARTNEGKSWLLLYFVVQAWLDGKKVLIYSGEMSADLLGFRIDTYLSNISNMGMMKGKEDINERYKEYIETLKDKSGIVVVTPQDFGGRKPTVDDLARLYEVGNYDLLAVDQLSLMADQRRGENKRIKYTNVSEDLFLTSERLGKPIILVVQANRQAEQDNKDEAPELHQIGESDGVGQNSTRVISIRVLDEILKLNIKKNRYGLNEKEILMQWDKDSGLIRPLVVSDEDIDDKLLDEFGF